MTEHLDPDNGDADAHAARHAARSGEPSAPASGRGEARRHDQAYELGRLIRGVREDVDHMRSEVRKQLDNMRSELHEAVHRGLREALAELAQLLPRVQELEDELVRLRVSPAAGAVPGSGPLDIDGFPSTGAAGPCPERGSSTPNAPATPATGWNQMDLDAAEQAWPALAEFVDRVLHRQYRLTRLQVPDCWPLHPRMVRELAWLRSSYVETADHEPDEPAASLPWHIRALPGFLVNAADAIDPRECRPGIHRLTESEVSDHGYQVDAARRDNLPVPQLSEETGPDAPRLVPEHFPTRTMKATTGSRRSENGLKAPTVDDLRELIVGPCHPDYWRAHYDAASAADLAQRSHRPPRPGQP